VHALAAVQSVKLIRNALAVRCVERGTVYSRLARRHEVAQRRHALWSATTRCLPQVGPDQRLRAVHKRLLDRHDHHCRGLLAVDGEAVPKVRIRADPSASVHAVGLVDTGDKEDQPNARVLNKISETINQIVAATVGNEQRPTVIRNLHEPRPITLRRTVEAFSASGGENRGDGWLLGFGTLGFGRKVAKLRIHRANSAVSFQLSYSSSLVAPDLTLSTFWLRQTPAALISNWIKAELSRADRHPSSFKIANTSSRATRG
jgi:hypothetical protein